MTIFLLDFQTKFAKKTNRVKRFNPETRIKKPYSICYLSDKYKVTSRTAILKNCNFVDLISTVL